MHMDPLWIRLEISSFQSAMPSQASSWSREDTWGSNIKMSPQKAGAILHWFSARYGDNSPLPCHHARKKQCTEVKCWTWSCAVSRVHQTVGNRSGLTGYRSNRSGPVPVWSGMKPVQIQNLNLNSKKWKIPKKFLKILQGATNLMVSIFLQNLFI